MLTRVKGWVVAVAMTVLGCSQLQAVGGVIEDMAVTFEQQVELVDSSPYATGGEGIFRLKDGSGYIHVFTSTNGVSNFVVGEGSDLEGEVIVVGGGGAGGSGWSVSTATMTAGGGGGGGGVRWEKDLGFYKGDTFDITVGRGGKRVEALGNVGKKGENGGPSSFEGGSQRYLFNVLGGGAGGMASPSADGTADGDAGASGGGASGIFYSGGPKSSIGRPGLSLGYGKNGGAAGISQYPNRNLQGWIVAAGGGGGAVEEGLPGTHGRDVGTFQSGGAGRQIYTFFNCDASCPFAVGGGGAAGAVGVEQSKNQTLIGQFLDLTTLDVSGGTSFASQGSQGSGSGKDGYGGGGAGGTGYTAIFFQHLYYAGNGGSGVVLVRYKPVDNLCKHNWVDVGDPTPKTCTEDGTTEQKCSICEETRTLIDPATGHKWNDQGVCSVCQAHQPCAVCQWEDRGYAEGQEPTCTADGVMNQECSVCHDTRRVTAFALGHDWADSEVETPAYCESSGIGTRTCKRCDESEAITIPAKGHEWKDENWNVNKEPNCTEDGSRENECTRLTAAGTVCRKVKTEVIPALGHDFDEDSVCRRCGVSEAKSRLVQDLRDKMRFWEGAKEVRESPYATGGDMILMVAGKTNEYIHIFSDPNAVKRGFVVGDKPLLARTLVAGGGGGGGFAWKYDSWNYSSGGGGGGGEVKVDEDVWLAAGATYTATVGAGGAAGPSGQKSGSNVLKGGENGESTTFSGGQVLITALGGGGGGSASSNQTACCGKSLATGGGAAAWIDWDGGATQLLVGVPGTGSVGGDGGDTNAVMNADGTAYTFTMAGGGGGAGKGEAATGRDGSAALPGVPAVINPHGGIGIHSDILGYDLGFGGGGGGGSLVAGQGAAATTHYGADGGGTSYSWYQPPSGLPTAPTEDGYSGYGGGGGGAGVNGYWNKNFLAPGGAGGAGVVIVRYRELGIDPAYPLVTLTSAEATSETTADINWRLRDFGEGKSSADVYLEYGRADGKEPKKRRVKIQTVTEKGATGTYALTGLLPGRPYTFKVSAANGDRETYAEEVFTFDMPGGKSVWENASAMQDAENYHVVKFSARIGYVGEETSTVAFRWKQEDEADWHQEAVGAFSRSNPPPESGYSFEKLFLTLSTVEYEFIVENDGTGGDIHWAETVAGKCALTKGVLTEAYWRAKTINIRPEVDPEQSGTGSDGRETLVFTHDQDPAWGSDTYHGKDTFKIVKPTDGDHEGRPLLVGLHGRGSTWTSGPGDDGVSHIGSEFYYMSLDNSRGDDNNKDHDFLYWWGATPTHRGPEESGIVTYREENAISRRVLDCVEWAIRTYKIDRNRVYIGGNSMGGQGALAIGLPHGEVFAAIEANVPATIWYPCARMNFVDNSGKLLEVSDRDASLYNDPPPVLDWSGSNDIWSRDHHVLMNAMNRFRYAYVGLWGTFRTTWDGTGHEASYANARKYNDLVGRWDFYSDKFRRDLAYPVFTNAKEGLFNDGSVNNIPPWPWAITAYKRNGGAANDIMQPDPNGTASGSVIAFGDNVTTAGQRNFFFRWENGEDTASGVSLKLWVATAEEAETAMFQPPASAEVDVTLRRIQGFGLRPGQPVTWSFGERQNVAATADSDGLVTVRLTLTNEHQTFTLKPGAFADLTAEVDVLEVQERAIRIVADVLSLGDASSAEVSVEYTDEAGVTVTKALGTQGVGARDYMFGDLLPGKTYDVFVKVGTSVISLGKITTKYCPLAGTATVMAIDRTSFSLQWNCERIGTEATSAKVTVEWRREGEKTWTARDETTITAPGSRTFDFAGLDSGARYMARVTFTNGIDPDVFVDLGEFLTLCDGERRFVEVPAIPNLVATGAAQRPAVADTADYTVTGNEEHSAVGTYEVELTLADATNTRWVGAEGATIRVQYEIVEKVAGISVGDGANVETYTRRGDTYVIFHEGTDVEFTLDFDSRADILLVGGGGAGGRASNWDGGNDNRDGIHRGGVGAGGGAGGMREFSNVYLFGGTYKVSVGEGAVPAVNNATRGVKGGSSSIVGGTVDLSVTGGGSGGHASTQIWSGGLAMGVKGASSGGSLLGIGYGHAPSMNNALGLTYFIEGEGNYGGRVGGYIEKGFWGGGVGGGGAGAPGPWVDASKDFGNECYPGGIGRISKITGDEIYYAGGGASGSFAYPDKTCEVEGTLGGGGASRASEGVLVSESGVDGLGGGGAGGSYCNEEMCEPGRGGRGIVIVRLLGYSASDCEHAETEETKPGVAATCETAGVTPELTCKNCHKVVASPAPIAPLGHDYDHTYDYSIGGKGDVCTRCHQVSPFTKIARIYFSDDRRHVFLNGHRGLVSEKLRIPENSLAAIRYAIEMGLDCCEVDPSITHDGVIILSHDAAIASRQLYNFTPTHDAENYIVGSGATANWYGELEEAELRVSDNINEGSGEKVALLEDVLDLCKDKCFVNLDCDWWRVDANKVVKMIRDRHMEKQCVLWDVLFTRGNKPMPDDLFFQVNDRRPGAWGGSLDQNEPEGQNDSSSHPNPDRFGWERIMNVYGSTSFMTNEPLELMDYLKSIGRRSPNWEIEPEDQRARPTVRIPAMELKRFVKGQPIKYGIRETEDWRVISDGPEGGDPERNEYFFELELKDPGKRWANGDFKNTSNLRKKFWYYAEVYDEDVVSALPTDFVDGGKADRVLGSEDGIDGLSWTGATRAYQIGDETVLIFANTTPGATFTVGENWEMSGRALLVAGGGPGGLNSTTYGQIPGAGGGAGGMLETPLSFIGAGTYAVTVGAGGAPVSGNTTVNGRGGDSFIADADGRDVENGAKLVLRAFGGGGGGHGCSQDCARNPSQTVLTRGVNGGSSGGSMPNSSYGWNKSIEVSDWLESAVAGQGNPGGRIGGNTYRGKCNSSVGGGGASLEKTGYVEQEHEFTTGFGAKFDMSNAPSDDLKWQNRFTGGGQGRASDITGSTVTYAGGGAGGSVYSIAAGLVVKGGNGGGGCTDFSSHTPCGSGVNMLGGGGAGQSIRTNVKFAAGSGGSGVVIIRVTKLEEAGAPHDLPTVDGEEVRPRDVFSKARSNKPISYPSAPRLINLEDGRQQIEFGNSVVDVPRYYRASLQNEVEVVLVLNEKAIAPLDTAEPKPFDVGATSVSFSLTKADILPNIFYGVVATDDLSAKDKWTLAVVPIKGDVLLNEKGGTITVEKTSDTKQFYKLSATDIPPEEKAGD